MVKFALIIFLSLICSCTNEESSLSEEERIGYQAIFDYGKKIQFEQMGLASAIPALKERIPVLQRLAQEPGITIERINALMSPRGRQL